MFSVSIRRHVMIAHSLPHPDFGPAQALHGATYVVDAEFFSPELNACNVVIDIGLADELLGKVLAPLAYQNLDEMPAFKGVLTTTEFLALYIHRRLSSMLCKTQAFAGRLKITLHESHVAKASYEGEVK